MKKASKLTLSLGLACGLCAVTGLARDNGESAKAEAQKAGENALTKIYDAMDKNTADVDFEKGSAQVAEGEIASIRALVRGASSDGKIERVVVAAWPDTELPASKDAKIPEEAKELAKKRVDNLEKALKDMGVEKVEAINMAEKPNWFEKNLGMDEAKVKEAAKGADVGKSEKDTRIAALGRTLKDEGGASKAVVVVETTSIAH